MNHHEILKRLDEERRSLVYDSTVTEILPQVTRVRAIDGSHHSIVFSSLKEFDADEVINEQIAHYRELRVPFEWMLFAHDTPSDLMQRLERTGFHIGPCETVLVYDLKKGARLDDEHSIRVMRIERSEQVDDFRRAAESVFGKDYSFTSNELREALRTGSTQHLGYIAYDGDEPVSIGRLYTHPRSVFGGLYGGGTLATHRGKGFYRALVAERARDAVALGAQYLRVDALPTSCPILQRMGFEQITQTWPCEWNP